VRWCEIKSAVVENASSFERYIFGMKLPIGFTYRNLHGFARFPGDSTAAVFLNVGIKVRSTSTTANVASAVNIVAFNEPRMAA